MGNILSFIYIIPPTLFLDRLRQAMSRWCFFSFASNIRLCCIIYAHDRSPHSLLNYRLIVTHWLRHFLSHQQRHMTIHCKGQGPGTHNERWWQPKRGHPTKKVVRSGRQQPLLLYSLLYYTLVILFVVLQHQHVDQFEKPQKVHLTFFLLLYSILYHHRSFLPCRFALFLL